MISDPLFQGTGEDAAGYAKSMSDLVNIIVARKLKEAAEAAASANASSSGDASMTHIVGKAGKHRPIRPGVALAISSGTEPTPAQKREGEEIDIEIQPAIKKSGEEVDMQVTA